MEFGLLGPLVVRVGGSRVTVSAGKQRVLLAALLLRANQVVSAADLAHAVWEGGPPATARVTLQNYVKRLRHVLGPAGPERIVTRPAGYLIEVRPGELDVARFGELSAAGLAAARAGSWERASAQLGLALGLWRGQPLVDVPSQVLAVAEVPRLAALRLDAVEARIDADLHLGRHREVVAELQALVVAEPLRERLHELLMLGLYRSGQQAAALAAYRQARRRLVEEVGIEPGPGLRRLNQQILHADDDLLAPLPAPAAPRDQDARAGESSRAGEGAEAGGTGGGGRAGAGRRAGESGGAAGGAGQGGGAGQAAESPPDVLRPSLLPTAVPGFTGRAFELRALSARTGRGGGPVLITAIGGTAGVGKTALAVHWARRHADRFPDGQLYLNLRGFGPGDPVAPAEALRGFLDALQVPAAQIPATLDERRDRYRALLDGKKILILLDNARDTAQVRPLLPAGPDALVLVTSRNQLTDLITEDAAGQICLDVLATADARQLLAHRLGPARVAAEPAAADELIGLCARLPLALAITAARAAAHPGFSLAALAAELRDARGRLDALSTGEDTADVRAVFSWSYQDLPVPAARMFRLLGLHPGPDITAHAAASLADLTVPEASRLLRDLTRGHLLSEHAPGRYGFHDLLRAYAGEQATLEDTPALREAATARMLDHYLHTAHAAALALNPSREPITLAPARPGVTPERLTSHHAALAWFEAEHHVLIATVTHAANTGHDIHAWQLPWAMTTFLDGHGHWHQQATLQRTALDAATRLGDKAGQAAARRLLAHNCARLGDYDQAHDHLTSCVELYRQIEDHAGEARTHQSLSWVADQQDHYADALVHDEQALALFEAIGNQSGMAMALNSLGWHRALLGDYQRALESCRQALTLHRELGNRHGEAATWDSLGYAHHHLGQHADAVACHGRAVDLLAELGDRVSRASALTHLGDAQLAAGDDPAARRTWEQALAILDGLSHPDAAGVRGKLRRLGPARRGRAADPTQLTAMPGN